MAVANHILLRRTTLSATASSVVFDLTGVTGYTDLKIVMSPRGNYSDDRVGTRMTFNGVTSGYSYRRMYAYDGSGTASDSASSAAYIDFGSIPSTSATASTFGHIEAYILGYAGSNYKSVSVEQVAENNSSSRFVLGASAALWSNSAAITSISLFPSNNDFVAGSSFSLYGIANVNTTPTTAPKADGGDIIKTDGTYWYHAFLSTGSFKPQLNLTCDYLVVAGGGSGAADLGGGGGAGGYRTSIGGSALSLLANTSYTATVGAGGAATSTSGVNGNKGSDSIFSTITSTGGGGGNGYNASVTSAMDGGSGGGSGSGGTSGTTSRYGSGNTPSTSPSQGNRGGTGTQGPTNPEYSAGGGGGAGAVGGAGSGTTGSIKGGVGGAGLNSASAWATATGTGVSGYYAGGGGASSYQNRTTGNGAGGAGGGGGGTAGNTILATAGTANTGGGGGGGSNDASPYIIGQAGGSGIIIIRYPVA